MITNNKVKNKLIENTLVTRTEKRKQNIKFSSLMEKLTGREIDVSKNTLMSIRDCGSFLEFISDFKFEKNKLINANFCNNRFCPHCSYNKSRREALELNILVEYLRSKGYKFIFLTLTAPNVPGEQLEDELKNYSKSFKKLFERKEIKSITKGYVRKLEVTYNQERNDYHPHYHVLIAVNKSYFTDTKSYLSRDIWLKYWQESKEDFSITQVDVRRFKDKNDTAIFEITKYLAKDSNYLTSDEVFLTFYKSLKGKRVYSYNGEFKDARKLYKEGQLDYLKTKDETEYFYKLYSVWKNGHYDITDLQMLTDEEFKKYNIDFIDEIELN